MSSNNLNELIHDSRAERPTTDLRCPTPVRRVAAVLVPLAVFQFFWAVVSFSTSVLAPAAFIKGLLGIAIAIGLLNLRQGWRVFLLITTGLGLVGLPLYFLAVLFSPNFAHWFAELSGIESRLVIALVIAVHFAVFLWMFRSLLRADVGRAFNSE